MKHLKKGDEVAGLIWGGEAMTATLLSSTSFARPPSLVIGFCMRETGMLTVLELLGEKKFLGAYGQYTYADDDMSFKIPSNIKPEEAATVPLAAATSWLALLSTRCLGMPRNGSKIAVLIWGGSCQ